MQSTFTTSNIVFTSVKVTGREARTIHLEDNVYFSRSATGQYCKKLLLGVGRVDPAEFDLSGIDTIFCKVEAVIINRFANNVFYAKLLLTRNDDEAVEVDCAPAKAVAHGIRAEAPIFADETVLDKAGIAIGA